MTIAMSIRLQESVRVLKSALIKGNVNGGGNS